jgi:signal transduction histidine kinase
MIKAPLPPDETERVQALRGYSILDTEPEESFDDLVLLASCICQTPMARISLLDENRQWFKAQKGMDVNETPRDIAFCAHGILQRDVFVVPDASQDERFANNPLVTADPEIRFYAGAPLMTPEGHAIGMICVNDRVPRQLSAEQLDALRALSRMVMTELELRHELAERKPAEERMAALQSQLIEAARRVGMADVATSVLHNVGNVLNSVNVSATLVKEKITKARLSGLDRAAELIQAHSSDLGAFLTENPQGKQFPQYLALLAQGWQEERQALLKELESLARNLSHIRDIIARQQSLTGVSGAVENVSLSELLDEALQMGSASLENHGITVVRDYGVIEPVVVDKMRLTMIVVNLLRNAKESLTASNQAKKCLTIRSESNGDGQLRVRVIDNGLGIAPENLPRVFSWGFTTKPGGHGFGLHSSAMVAKEMGGSLHASSDGPGKGAQFVLELPVNYQTKASGGL